MAKLQSAINKVAPSSFKDVVTRTIKTFVAGIAGAPLTIALFSLNISSLKAMGIAAGITATNVVMNALLAWAKTE